MDQFCLVVPILPSRTADARDFRRELEAGPNADYRRVVLYQRSEGGLFTCVAVRRACRCAAGWGEVCARR